MRKRCAGVAAIILIVLIAVGVVAVILSFVFTGEKEKVQARLQALDKRTLQVSDAIKFTRARIERIAKIAGAKGEKEEDIGVEDLTTTVEAEHKVLAEGAPEEKKEVLFPTLERLLWANLEKAYVAESVFTRSVGESEIANEAAVQADKRFSTAEKAAGETKTSLDGFSKNLSKQLADETEKFRVRIEALTEAEKNYSDQLTAMKDTYEKQLRQMASEIMENERKLQTLLTKEAVVKPSVDPQGALFKVDPQSRFAFVDIGVGKNLVRGQKFMVFRKGLGDSPSWVALAEVKEIFDTHSLLSITHLFDTLNPPVAGDYVANPLYDPQRARVVVLLGDINTHYYAYEKEEVMRRMQLLGIKVTTALDDKVDFIVVGRNYENLPLYNEAIQFRIPIHPADYILQFIGD